SSTFTHEETAKVVDADSMAWAAGVALREDGSGQYRLQKRSNILRFCFAYPGGPPPDWLGPTESAMFCGHFNRRSTARARGEGVSDSGSECVPRRRALGLEQPTESGPSLASYESGNQGVHSDGAAEFRGIRLAREFLQRIDRLQA